MKTTTYNGGKSGSGSFQQIINEIPPITHFVSGFLGNCPLARYFDRKVEMTGYEPDYRVIEKYWTDENNDYPHWIHRSIIFDHWKRLEELSSAGAFIYLDPPYLFETRKSKKPMYRHEFGRKDQHVELLEKANGLSGMVAISSYPSDIYDEYLRRWRKKEWQVGTRNGKATECLWMNYPEPRELFTYDFLGKDRTDRQRIKRKLDRILCRLEHLPQLEAMAIVDRLNSKFKGARD